VSNQAKSIHSTAIQQEIHKRDVAPPRTKKRQQVSRVRKCADDRDVRYIGKQLGKPQPDYLMIIKNGDMNRLAKLSLSTHRATLIYPRDVQFTRVATP
jgi:hypothetical protein